MIVYRHCLKKKMYTIPRHYSHLMEYCHQGMGYSCQNHEGGCMFWSLIPNESWQSFKHFVWWLRPIVEGWGSRCRRGGLWPTANPQRLPQMIFCGFEAGRKLNHSGNNSSWALWPINANPACPAKAGRTACTCTLSTVYTRHAPNTILNKNEKRTAKTTLRADVSFNVTSLIHHGWHKNCYIINSSSRMNKVWQTALIARINKNR